MILSHFSLPFNIGVWWVLFHWTVVGADYEDLSCAREQRARQYLSSVPCDLITNSFCDDSGENYPWNKLRKFVFENQAMIKRMYGYEKHSAVLKDEFDSLFYDEDDVIHPPVSNRAKNSIRSNAFEPRNEDPQNEKSRQADGRALKNKHHGTRSINSGHFNGNQNKYTDPKHQLNQKQIKEITKYSSVRISQGYATKTNAGYLSDDQNKKPSVNYATIPADITESLVRSQLSTANHTKPAVTSTLAPKHEELTTQAPEEHTDLDYEETTSSVDISTEPTISTVSDIISAVSNYTTTQQSDSTFTATEESTVESSTVPDYMFDDYTTIIQFPDESESSQDTESPVDISEDVTEDYTTVSADESDGVEITTHDSSDDGPSEFKFPVYLEDSRDDLSVQQRTAADAIIINSDRRKTNGKRPAAYGESRQPSRSSYIIDTQGSHKINSNPKVRENIRNQMRWHRTSTTQQPTTTTKATTDTVSSSIPPPPTPSSIPVPPVRSHSRGFSACPVETGITTPYWANNTRGEPRAILNLSPFDQFVHWEKCRFEYSQMDCRSGCRCEQQYRLHRMLAFDPYNDCRGVFSDWFKFPSGCVCKCYTQRVFREYHSRNMDAEARSLKKNDNEQSGLDFVNTEVRGERVETDDENDHEDADLSDVFFESEDDLISYGANDRQADHSYNLQAEERMDKDWSIDPEENGDLDVIENEKNEERVENQEEDQPGELNEDSKKEQFKDVSARNTKELDKTLNELKIKIAHHAVLEGEPIHSLYSRVKTLHERQRVPPTAISPQRRPRPNSLVNRFSRVNFPTNFKTRYDPFTAAKERLLNSRHRFGKFSMTNPYQQAHSRSFAIKNKYNSNRNGWNPQASFPRTLSNPLFHQLSDNSNQGRDSIPKGRSIYDNLSANHRTKSDEIENIDDIVISSPKVGRVSNVNPPQYFFNLTSHLIRSQKRDYGSRLLSYRNKK